MISCQNQKRKALTDCGTLRFGTCSIASAFTVLPETDWGGRREFNEFGALGIDIVSL